MGFDERKWAVMPVRVVTSVRGADGNFPMREGWPTGPNENVDGEVTVIFRPEKGGEDKTVEHRDLKAKGNR